MLFEMCFIAESVQANRDMLGHYSHQGQAQTVAAVRRLPQRPVGASVTSHCKSGRHGTVDDWRPEWRIFPCGAPRVSEGPSHVHTGSWFFFFLFFYVTKVIRALHHWDVHVFPPQEKPFGSLPGGDKYQEQRAASSWNMRSEEFSFWHALYIWGPHERWCLSIKSMKLWENPLI